MGEFRDPVERVLDVLKVVAFCSALKCILLIALIVALLT